jgi:acyl carrier protein
MIPQHFVTLDAIPLTPNRKADRKVLPAPMQATSEFVAPETATQKLLADVWSEVLDVDDVGAEDDFFDLGGHSILATRVVARIEERTGIELPLRRIFGTPRLRGLADHLEALQALRDAAAHDADEGERQEVSF